MLRPLQTLNECRVEWWMSGDWERQFWREVSRIERCMVVCAQGSGFLTVPARALRDPPGALTLELSGDLAAQGDVCVIFCDPMGGTQMSVHGRATAHTANGASKIVVAPRTAQVWGLEGEDVIDALGTLTNTTARGGDEPVLVEFGERGRAGPPT